MLQPPGPEEGVWSQGGRKNSADAVDAGEKRVPFRTDYHPPPPPPPDPPPDEPPLNPEEDVPPLPAWPDVAAAYAAAPALTAFVMAEGLAMVLRTRLNRCGVSTSCIPGSSIQSGT